MGYDGLFKFSNFTLQFVNLEFRKPSDPSVPGPRRDHHVTDMNPVHTGVANGGR